MAGATRDEHGLASPYLVVGKDSQGWGIHCNCGWRLPLVDSEEAAMDAGRQHLREPEAGKPTGLRGWWERRKARYHGPERRFGR